MALSFIKSSGNIITEDFCLALSSETKADFVKDKSFGAEMKKVDEVIASTFEKLRERWEENRTQILGNEFDNATIRKKWILPLLEALGYQPVFVASNIKSESGIEYQIPYKGWDSEYAPLIHMVNSAQDFDIKDKNSRTHSNKSPQDCLQQYLNTSHHQWGILINGKKVRLLRDFYHSITKGFLEFDLESIFETASTEQFRVLFRILHRSRIENQYQGKQEIEYDEEGNPIEVEDTCLLESFHKKSRETGVKVGNKLRDQVIEAIEKLGNGFAESLDPDEFQNGKVKSFYAEILNIIYRLLFLMFAEQKGWLPVRNSIYARTYSLNALRELAERGNYSHDEEHDLWEGLKITFKLVANGYEFKNGDKINAFGGQLFSDKKIAVIKDLALKNKHLLDAIYRLSYFKLDNLSNRINYANLAIDELGSVYESLLDYEPKLARENFTLGKREIKRGEFYLDDRGTDRKTTGSYYTDSRLVAQLIESALVPVINNALMGKNTLVEKEQALLDLKVADIACGSGAFICAALEKLGEQLALIRMGDEERPTEDQLREAKRDVLLHCIYGVDLNPMALELAKFSLWITASLPDMPLTFLDHKLKCGNSLIGATPELIERGIPEEAYKPIGNDNPAICTELKKKVRRELESKSRVNEPTPQYGIQFKRNETDELLRLREALNSRKQELVSDVDLAEEEYLQLEKMERKFKDWLMADVWTAAFFIEKIEIDLELYPSNITLESLRENQPVKAELIENILKVADKNNFFHFHLEFPEVFEKGGFDCLLGNPPWEKIKIQELEFFSVHDQSISQAITKNKIEQLINTLKTERPEIHELFLQVKRSSEVESVFFKFSGRYKYGNAGDINLYALFAETYFSLLNKQARSGFIVPPGIATDDTYKKFIKFLINENILEEFFNFTNRGYLFAEVESTMAFALYTFTTNKEGNLIRVAAKIWQVEHLQNPNRIYFLTPDDVQLLNPNTENLPIFENSRDSELTKNIYLQNEILSNERSPSLSSWQIQFGSMLHMTNDSHLFKTLPELVASGYTLNGNIFRKNDNVFVPVYESKLIYQFNHRAATFEGIPEERKYLRRAATNPATISDLENLSWRIQPRYWIEEAEVENRLPEFWKFNWLIGYRNAINAVADSRSTILTVIPRYGVGNSLPLVFGELSARDMMLLVANFNSFILDYVTRQKASGGNLNFYVVKQLAVIGHNRYSESIKNKIVDNISTLLLNSDELIALSLDLGLEGKLYKWSSRERFRLQCELDAIYAHLYGLEKEEMDYLLETFPIVKRKDIDKYGSYRTKETILQLYDEFVWVKEERYGNVLKT
jgi:hypothetical protein